MNEMIGVEFIDEDKCIEKIKIDIIGGSNIINVLINDSNDETMVPNFDFDYEIIDCMSINDKNIWNIIVNTTNPIVLINTCYLFEQWKDISAFDVDFNDGRINFAYILNCFFSDILINNNKKLIFIANDEDAIIFSHHLNCISNIKACITYFNVQNKKFLLK